VSQEKAASTAADTALMKRLAGRLLLQVENKGYIWYVNPDDNKRYFISQESALDIFRKLSLGITEANLNLIPTKESGKKGDTKLRERLKGKLLLRVENKGSVSYVDVDGYRHDISQANLMDIFRSLSLGISNENIRKMTVGELK
jgi:phage pi2 protein 07